MRQSIAVTALALAVVTAAGAFPGVRLGGGTGGFGYVRAPGYWGPSPYSDPFWYYGGFAHSGFPYGFSQSAGMGQVKLTRAPKDAMVFLDGAYAGEVRKLRNLWLDPGVYQLEVRDGSRRFERRIYVLSGKTLELKATPQEVAPSK